MGRKEYLRLRKGKNTYLRLKRAEANLMGAKVGLRQGGMRGKFWLVVPSRQLYHTLLEATTMRSLIVLAIIARSLTCSTLTCAAK